MVKIFISGPPGSGKTRLALEVLEEMRKRGKSVAGIISPEIKKEGVRWGFKIIDLASKKEQILASIECKGPKVGKYHVNVAGIDEIVSIFEKSADADVILIDEIGIMELFSKAFVDLIERILRSDKDIIAVVHRNLRKKYESIGKSFWLTKSNREEIKKRILEELNLST
jgi:nucleoside-triphosphatase